MAKNGKRDAMTFLEMVICLAVLAVCFVVMVRGFGNMGILRTQTQDDAVLFAETETLIAELEGQPASIQGDTLTSGWRYQTEISDGKYILHVMHETRDREYAFILNEVGG